MRLIAEHVLCGCHLCLAPGYTLLMHCAVALTCMAITTVPLPLASAAAAVSACDASCLMGRGFAGAAPAAVVLLHNSGPRALPLAALPSTDELTRSSKSLVSAEHGPLVCTLLRSQMKAFSLEGYKKATAMPFHKSPNSILGRAIGILHSFPALAKRGYDFLKDEKGFSDMAIIAGVLVIPLTIGAVFICVLDAMYTRQPHLNHQHYE
eukprot:GHRQ01010899.1.p1 GENE.GHRQ01010899.1~~GHRQ01010899.1.p1  ORF type:complete len:208 (+),score=38.12 GHRQ01010899.1:849-1472(+)